MNATALLAIQHWNLDRQLAVLEDQDRAGRRSSLIALAEELVAHLAVEKNLFYPLAEELGERLLAEERDVHRCVLRALKDLLLAMNDDVEFTTRVRALRDTFDDHAAADERPMHAVLDQLTLRELSAVGSRMQDFYDECLRARRGAADAA
jgi:hypothetical protein